MKSKSFIKDFLLYGLNNVLAKVLAIVVVPIITSVFSVGEFGIIDTGISVLTVLPLLVGLGYDMVLKRDLIIYKQDRKKSQDTIFTMLLFVAVWGALAVVVMSLFSTPLARLLFTSDEYSSAMLFALISVYFNTFIGFIIVLCRTSFKLVRFTIISILKLLLEYGFIIYAIIVLEKGVVGYFGAICLVDFAYAIVLLIIYRKALAGRFNIPILKESLKFGIPTMVAGLGYWIFNLSDRILITNLSNSTQTGYYSMAIKMLGVYTFLVTAFKQAWVPRAFELFREDKDTFPRHLERMHHYSLAFFSFMVLANFAGLRLMIMLFSNPDYLPGLVIAAPLVMAFILYPLAEVASIGLYLSGKTKALSNVVWIAAVINIAINVIWIPVYGSIIASASTLASYLFIYVTYWWMSCHYMKWRFSWFKPVFVLVMAAGSILGICIISIENIWLDLLCKLAITAVFLGIMLATRLIRIDYIKKTIIYFFKRKETVKSGSESN